VPAKELKTPRRVVQLHWHKASAEVW
jgi:hypothetical protein